VDRLCNYHAAYRWLCGGVPVNHNLLSEFRRDSGAILDPSVPMKMRHAGSAGGISPPAAHRTVRKPLNLHGSSQPFPAASRRQPTQNAVVPPDLSVDGRRL
jgi:hypothetical protein